MKEWADYTLTEEERGAFERDGYFMIENALPPEDLARVVEVVDRLDAENSEQENTESRGRLNMHDLIGKHDVFIDLMDWPRTFPKAFGLLGWNIQLFHTQLVMTPPGTDRECKKRLGFHQDNNRMNKDFETARETHPRVSMKVAFFLTDTTEVGRANFYIVPGAHVKPGVRYVDDETLLPEGAIATQVKAGDAVVFDRRLWHAASPNITDHPRKVLFYGYSYRWLRTKSNMDLDHLYDQLDPIRKQLIGYATNGNGRFAPLDEDVPLKAWIEENLGEKAVVA